VLSYFCLFEDVAELDYQELSFEAERIARRFKFKRWMFVPRDTSDASVKLSAGKRRRAALLMALLDDRPILFSTNGRPTRTRNIKNCPTRKFFPRCAPTASSSSCFRTTIDISTSATACSGSSVANGRSGDRRKPLPTSCERSPLRPRAHGQHEGPAGLSTGGGARAGTRAVLNEDSTDGIVWGATIARAKSRGSRSIKDGMCQQAKKKTQAPTW
jgi:hypothetical protein